MRPGYLGILFVIALSANAVSQDTLETAGDLHWTVMHGDWTVENGILTGTARDGAPAILVSEKEYWDVTVDADFRTPIACNGGVFVRAHWLPDPAHSLDDKQLYGYQANIETRLDQGTGELHDHHGRGRIAEASEDTIAALRRTDWNELTLSAKRNAIEIHVNGDKAVQQTDDRYIGGRVALQVLPKEVDTPVTIEFRNIRIDDHGRMGDWVSLFDGVTLKGWTEWGNEKWTVEDGAIVGRSGPYASEGYLATDKVWRDFRVRGRFKMMGAGNFGLFYHSSIRMGERQGQPYPFIRGLQGEVDPAYPGPTGWVYESYQRGWLVEPDRNSVKAYALRPEKWNEIEIRSVENHITTWVNGFQVLDYVDPGQQLFQGAFALQLHTGGTDGIQWKALYVEGNPAAAE